MLARERKALQRLAGIQGIPRRIEGQDCAWATQAASAPYAAPRRDCVGLREFVEGAPLSKATCLPENFFDRLAELVERMHAVGVCHNDLHKEQNILVGEDGYPSLIDFQLASVHSVGSRAHRVRCYEDLRHVQKHRRRYLRDGRGPGGARAQPRGTCTFAAQATVLRLAQDG